MAPAASPHLPRSPRLANLAGLILLVGCQPAEWTRYSPTPMPSCHGEAGWRDTHNVVFRVVDERGDPIARADVFATYEDEHPRGGASWASGRTISDDDGLVQLAVDGACDLVVVQASGRATAAEEPDGCDVMVLPRALAVPIRVVDWLGRPAIGELGYTRYCGHRPDLEVARIGDDGITWLRHLGDFQPEIHPRASGLGEEYRSLGWPGSWRPGLPPLLFRLQSSPTILGLVLDALGQPMPGVPIGGASQHRGPWTVTDEAGRFQLEHLSPGDGLVVDVAGVRHWLNPPPVSSPCTVRLPDARGLGDEDQHGTVRLRGVLADGTPVPGNRLELRSQTTEVEADGITLRLEHLPPGTHAIAIDGALSQFEAPEVTVSVAAQAVVDLVVTVRERPRVRFVVRGTGDGRPGPAVHLVGPTWSAEVTQRCGQPIPVPGDGAAAFWIGNRCHPLPADFANRSEPIELVPPQPHIVGRLLDGNGQPVVGTVARGDAVTTSAADGTFRLPAGIDASDDPLVLRSGDPALPARTLPMRLPTASDDRDYEVGDVRLWREGPLHICSREGEPLRDGRGALLRDGRAVGTFALRDGSYEGPEPRAGDEVRFEFPGNDGDFPGHALLPLRGPGPWILREPGGVVTFEVVDETGRPLDAHLWHGLTSAFLRGRQRLRGLAAGPHRFAFSAADRLTCTVQIQLHDGEHRRLHIVLPPR